MWFETILLATFENQYDILTTRICYPCNILKRSRNVDMTIFASQPYFKKQVKEDKEHLCRHENFHKDICR